MAKRAIRNGPPSAFGQNVDKPPKAATTFPFLRLPPEIRNTVYALIIPTVVRLSPPPTADKKSCGCWALAHVSKEIRKEFLPVFYSTARLTIDLQHEAGEALWSQWITSVGDSWIALVKHLVIEAKIEVERSLSRNRGYFFQNRIFERMNYMIDCPHATGGIEVNSEWEEREEVATYSQCAFRGPDKE
ncbi:MAG: hypothetical protein L6R39_006778 [Caloplaca ligustica]|nr:MAG: hypothetical protein L6R39_006778 [Caloplaca ligustica]